MKTVRKTVSLVLCFALLLAFAGCANPDRDKVSAVYEQSIGFLKLVKEETANLEAIMVQELELFDTADDPPDIGGTFELDKFKQEVETAKAGIDTIQKSIDESAAKVANAETPVLQQLADTKAAFAQYCLRLKEPLIECEKLLDYTVNFLNALVPIIDFQTNPNASDPMAYFSGFNEACKKCVSLMQSFDVPSYLKSGHDGLIDIISQLEGVLDGYYVALTLDDPLRASSSNYRFYLTLNKFTDLSEEFETSLDKQYAIMRERLQENVAPIAAEINENVDTLIAYFEEKLEGGNDS